MRSSPLRILLLQALRSSLAAPLALTACGSTPQVDATTGYASPACDNGALSVSGLKPAVQPDAVELRQLVGAGTGTPSSAVLSSTGTACATATDKQACNTAFDALLPSVGFAQECSNLCTSYYLATTRGDEVTAWTTIDQVKQLLGTIDTSQEAALLTLAYGYSLQCSVLDRGAVKQRADGGFDVVATKGSACGAGPGVTRFYLTVTPSGEVVEERSEQAQAGDPNCAAGRRPVGLVSTGRSDCDEVVGQHFATVAHLEAASVDAFLRLRDELALHGATDALRSAALLAALEEVRHAHVTTALAARYGASVESPCIEPGPLRSLVEVAIDNAVEGCVRETYGALVAHHQAAHAADPEVRAAMARIAEEETRHAELSWDIAAWATAELSPEEREAVRAAQQAAAATLREELSRPVPAALIEQAGLPDSRSALAMLEVLLQGLPALAA
jgi:hypothetical protein